MAKQGFRVIDVEPHMQEPYDLWERNLPEAYRKRLKLILPPEGHMAVGNRQPKAWLEGDVVVIDRTHTSEGQHISQTQLYPQAMRRWQTTPHLGAIHADWGTPDLYLEGFDTEGVDIGDLMPTMFGHIMTCDLFEPEFALALCQVYNDWAHDFCATHPDRFRFWGVVPIRDAKLAAKEAQRCIEELGAVGITSKDSGQFLANDETLAPLWEALDAYHAAVGFHGFCEGRSIRKGDSSHSRVDWIKRFSGPHANAAAGLIFGGVLDAHPNIKPLFMESGANAVPAMLEKMDDDWYTYGPDADFTLEMWPSQYYKQHCYTVTRDEGLLRFSIEYLGDDKLVFSTDYPHHDAPFPDGVNKFVAMKGVSDESKRKILWDNAVQLRRN